MASRLRQLLPVLQPCASPPPDYSGPFSTHTIHIHVTPKVSLFDQKIHVRVHGLPSKAKVTLHVRTDQEWRQTPAVFRSCGHFVTSDNGDLDLNRDASVGGTYTGVDPMGLFWSLAPCPSGPRNIRMVVKNVEDPILYTLSVYLDHCSLHDLVAKRQHTNLWSAPW
ncbi:bile acid-CoA:amino acid N-acyltransferase-like isoform X2 [Babylonia areolata]|uniref:bile acid-CoA:amino acid N-acyltransferase-like isoform X2 n=1 Tax=Babylonia areolata TaxID=304850 RepID=UPI003FD4CAF4